MSIRYKALRRQRYYDQKEVEALELDLSDVPCWCGEERPYYAPLPSRCDGYRIIHCFCGGDFCVCHWHGEVECFGCEDCQGGDFDDFDDREFDEEESCH